MFILYVVPMLVGFLSMYTLCELLFSEAETPANKLLTQYEKHVNRRH